MVYILRFFTINLKVPNSVKHTSFLFGPAEFKTRKLVVIVQPYIRPHLSIYIHVNEYFKYSVRQKNSFKQSLYDDYLLAFDTPSKFIQKIFSNLDIFYPFSRSKCRRILKSQTAWGEVNLIEKSLFFVLC